MALTVESLFAAVERVMMPSSMVSGRIICSDVALKETEERLFPASRHRSKRIKKKLVKRFGGEFHKVPAIFKLPNGDLVAHPALYREMQRAVPLAADPGLGLRGPFSNLYGFRPVGF